MDHVLFIGGVILNLILVIGLLIDPRVRSKAIASPGPLGHIKQQFFSARLVQSNRTVAGVAAASLVLVSGLYFQELSARDPSLSPSGSTTQTGGRTEIGPSNSGPTTVGPTPRVPVTYTPQIADEELRYMLGQSITAREAFRDVASRARTEVESRTQTRTSERSEPAYSAEQIEAAVGAMLSLIQQTRRARAEPDNPNEPRERRRGWQVGDLIDRANRQAEQVRQALSGEDVEATLRAQLEQIMSRQRQTEGEDVPTAPLPSDAEITQLISASLQASAGNGLPNLELSDDELRAVISGVRTLLRSRPPAVTDAPEPPDPVNADNALISASFSAQLDAGADALRLTVDVWQALAPLPDAATPDAQSVMTEVGRAGAQFRETLTRLDREVAAGRLTIGELDAIVALLTDANDGLRDAIFDAQALPDLPVYPPEPVVDAPDTRIDDPVGPPTGGPDPVRSTQVGEAASDRAAALTAATYVSLAALLAFLLASMSFQRRVRSGEFGRHRDEMRQLMDFALKRGLGPMPPAATAMGAAP